MKQLKALIIDKSGLHARAASNIVAEATKHESDIRIIRENNSANLKSIMNVMSLAISGGTEITIEVEGRDEELAFDEIIKSFKENKLIK